MISATVGSMSHSPLRNFLEGVLSRLQLFPLALLQLVFRLSIASVFWKSAQSKIASWDTTILLFTNEYHVPLLSPQLAAAMSASIELSCSVFIFFGLITRLATLPLLGMIFVIQTFVYPENWVEHLTWAAMLVFLLTRGPGSISLDRLLQPLLLGHSRGNPAR